MQKIFSPVIGAIISFLTWFIQLVAFFGDVTIWVFRTVFWGIYQIFKKLHIDARHVAPGFRNRLVKFFRHPLISQEKSFKVGLLTILALILGMWYFTRDLPDPKQLETRQVAQTTKIFDRNEKLLFNVYTDQNRTLVKLSDIPDNLKSATIAIEDKDFYKHKGFDVYGIVRAARETVFGHSLQGGSTITQQLVKSAFLSPERTVTRKIKELYLAFRVELAFPKDKILEMYLNQVPYGGTAWGASAAAEQYFGKNVKDLDLAEASLLAGLPAAPTYYSPFGQDPKRAKERQRLVLERMVEDHYISLDLAKKAEAEDIKYRSAATDIKAPHFVMYVRELLAQKYGEAMAAQGGLRVTTTLDLDIQDSAQKIVRDNIDKLKYLNVSNGAALVTKPKTGEILAMVGSKDFFDTSVDGNVNGTVALRQPGSSIKPINYATALEHHLITPATVIMDVPTTFGVAGTKPYSPVNYDGKFHGAVQTRFALGGSLNIPATKMLEVNGVENFIATASAMGLTTLTDKSRYGYSLTLGGGEVKMIDMAVAFGVFANAGKKQDLVPILKVEDASGKILEELKPQKISLNTPWDGSKTFISHDDFVLPEEVTYLISHILLDDSARAQTFGAGSILSFGGLPVSVKTGTTEDKRDNWAIGYTSGKDSRLVAVWVGNNDNTPMSPYLESGDTGAAPIWHDIMKYSLKDIKVEWPRKPDNIVFVQVCALSGMLPDHGCPERGEYFIKAFAPKDRDNVWDQKKKIQVYKDSHKQPGPNEKPTPDQLTEEDHIVISDPLQKDFCVGCPL